MFSSPRIACINDLKQLAQKRVPKMFFQYAESGSYSQQTVRRNATDFDKIQLRQRVAVDVSKRSTRPQDSLVKGRNKLEDTVMFPSSASSSSSSLPLALAPIGLCGMQHVNGEIQAARAAAKHGIPITLSTMSITSIEDMRAHTAGPPALGDRFFFQLYMMKDRDFMRRLIQRAASAGCGALVLTLDLQILGVRHADIHNGLSAPPKLCNLSTAVQLASRPRWCVQQLGAHRYNFGNIVADPVLASKVDDVSSLSAWTSGQFDPSIDWGTVAWIRNEMWRDKPLIVKGILDERDAVEACKVGCDAILVSNHGGRQLDGAPSSISRLHSIKKAVDAHYHSAVATASSSSSSSRPAIHFDGGVSTGQHVFKALALGASSVWIGRSYVYGLGALGEQGVDTAIDILRKELDVTMALTGTNKLEEIGLDKLIMTDEVKKEFGI